MTLQVMDNNVMASMRRYMLDVEKKEAELAYEAFQKIFGEDLHGHEPEVQVEWRLPEEIDNALIFRQWKWNDRLFLITRIRYEYVNENGQPCTYIRSDIAMPTEQTMTLQEMEQAVKICAQKAVETAERVSAEVEAHNLKPGGIMVVDKEQYAAGEEDCGAHGVQKPTSARR